MSMQLFRLLVAASPLNTTGKENSGKSINSRDLFWDAKNEGNIIEHEGIWAHVKRKNSRKQPSSCIQYHATWVEVNHATAGSAAAMTMASAS
ncbi:hypothetical protein CONLIGDRAFT_686700 [Coniochaeta ligniaria NRRL 30616]|uniref:Uncharacterized protein n=1 Tax=Coniochaeta ligniaria NRRL 30616 TaxID=1408157 RepID=A0A1J7I6Y1_9PEZI|nr:hypothetical protein CONLIGDRAFT_686700 [Coniochaeta ligniaria NRRL 30616]